MTRVFRYGLAACACLLLLPAQALAQSAIAGIVRDTSGAVLPGVTVEAASPNLIEKVRTSTTDGQGRFNIVDLRPGTYSVTFTLSGFSSVRREGIDLSAGFTATVNADLSVGAVEETVTVTGEAPLVDVEGTTTGTVMSKDLLDAVPNQRMVQRYTVFIPGVESNSLGISRGLSTDSGVLAIHGSRSGEANVMLDGVSTRNMNGVGGQTAVRYMVNQAMVQEVSISTGSAAADQQMSGIQQNVIPRQGGNTFSGGTYFHYTNDKLSASNLSAALIAAGLGASGQMRESWDINPSFGGPIMKDKLWFFGAYRHWGNELDSGIHYDLSPVHLVNTTFGTDLTVRPRMVYTPDLSRPDASFRFSDRSYAIRTTWQASQKNQFSFFYDTQPRTAYNRAVTAQVAPESSTLSPYTPNYLTQFVWKSPVTSRLLLEANITYQNSNTLFLPNTDPGLFVGADPADPVHAIGAVESSTGVNFRSATGGAGSSVYGNGSTSKPVRTAASASYVTGSHSFKGGMDWYTGESYTLSYRTSDLQISLKNGLPTGLTEFAPSATFNKLKADLGLYAQDRWVLRRLTLNMGLRYDYLNSYAAAIDEPGNSFLAPKHYDAVYGVPLWHDLSPRIGGSYDLFGTGKTAIKATVGRYVEGIALAVANAQNPVVTSVLSATRTWTDNGDFIPQCDFSNLDANGECSSISNRQFGQSNPNATTRDPNSLKGFDKRAYNWETTFQLQHQVTERLSVTGGYYRRWYGNQTTSKNTQLGADPSIYYNQFCVTAPIDSRLPGGGGNQICGFYDIVSAKRGVVQNDVEYTSNFGDRLENYNGFDLTMNARLPGGGQVSGGLSTGRTEIRTCYIVNSPQDLLFCDVKPPFRMQVKFLGVYTIPWDIQVSGAFQSLPGPEITASYTATNAEVLQTLNRNLSAGATATVAVPLFNSGTMYAPRSQQTDIRIGKVFRVRKNRLLLSLDVFNAFNTDGAQAVNTSYGSQWTLPTAVISPRLYRGSMQFDF